MDDAGAQVATDARQVGGQGQQGIDQGVGRVTRSGMHGQARGLVEDQQVFILVYHVHRYGFRLKFNRLWLWH